MYRYVNAGRKSSLAAADDHDRYFPVLLKLLQGRQYLVHHLEIDHVERRMCEREAGHRAVSFNGDTLRSRSLIIRDCHGSYLFRSRAIARSLFLRASVSPW